jgi:hypothetical protein
MSKMAMSQKKTKRGARKSQIPSTFQLLPPAFTKAFLAYKFLGNITEPGGVAIQQFRLNSIYDPDYTGTGTVAMGYSGLTTAYGLFRVVRVRVIARFALSTTGTATVGMLAGLNSTVTANYHLLEAEPNAVSRCIQGNAGGLHSIAEFNKVYDLAQVSGITRSQFQADMDFAHGISANPARPIYLTAYIASNNGSTQTAICNIRVIMEVECSQPLQSVSN